MTDDRLHELLDDAARTYRVPPEPDLDAIWADVEREAFVERPRIFRAWSRSPSWHVLSLAVAAALVVGVGVGRFSTRSHVAPSVVASVDSSAALPDGYDRTATELLGRTALLLSSLPAEARRGEQRRFATQASELLSTTRLLLDSPAASDPRFKELLEDLELILAQVARLKPGRGNADIQLITDALEARDVVPRIRSAVARFSLGDD
jgi:hypothetical protein